MRHFMVDITYDSDFKTLRQAYLEVKQFLETETGDTVISLKTQIDNDLGCVGDDTWELIEKFVTKYKLDPTGFDYSKHFLSEGELFGSGPALLTLLTLPLSIIIWLIRLLTIGKIDLSKKEIIPDWNRKTTHMTFGDLLTWYLTGKYNLRGNVRVSIKNAA